jgi:hypothetical protein
MSHLFILQENLTTDEHREESKILNRGDRRDRREEERNLTTDATRRVH